MDDFGNKLLSDILRDDLKTSMKEGTTIRKNAIRVILGEMSRGQNKDPDNLMIIKIIKKLIKDQRKGFNDQAFIAVCEDYIPEELKDLSKEVIIAWIDDNIDFSLFKNKKEAMRPIMTHFKGKADGDMVKALIRWEDAIYEEKKIS